MDLRDVVGVFIDRLITSLGETGIERRRPTVVEHVDLGTRNPFRTDKANRSALMAVTEFVHKARADGPVVTTGNAPAMATLRSLRLAGEVGVGAVQGIDGGVPLPAFPEEEVHLLRHVVIGFDRELIFLAVIRIV